MPSANTVVLTAYFRNLPADDVSYSRLLHKMKICAWNMKQDIISGFNSEVLDYYRFHNKLVDIIDSKNSTYSEEKEPSSIDFIMFEKFSKDYNLDISKLYEPLYMRPLSEVKLQGYMADSMKVTPNGVGYMIITDDILKKYGVDVASSGNMINNFNYINEVKVWLAITEDLKNGIFKINIRSRGPIINSIAEKYNGGGHKLASGAKVTIMDDVNKLIDDLDKACHEYDLEKGDVNEN